ncbi:hypothetical protein SB773_19460 [Bacillus sp. SIMBA_074]|uniref:hypothetical protein n=1 Tax=Bacillus sp. SIMBA_074 TaxID=3085812 RepID=UPI00397BD90F
MQIKYLDESAMWNASVENIISSLSLIRETRLPIACQSVGIKENFTYDQRKGKHTYIEENLGEYDDEIYTIDELIDIQRNIVRKFYPYHGTEQIEEWLYQADESYPIYQDLLNLIINGCAQQLNRKCISDITKQEDKEKIIEIFKNLAEGGSLQEKDLFIKNQDADGNPADLQYVKSIDIIKNIIGSYNPRKPKKYIELARKFCTSERDQKKLMEVIDSLEEKKLGYIVFCTSEECRKKKKIQLMIKDVVESDLTIIDDLKDLYMVFAENISEDGLTWGQLFEWWEKRNGKTRQDLIRKLRSVCNEPEKFFFDEYYSLYKDDYYPAILPQVTISYSPILSKSDLEKLNIVPEHRYTMDFMVIPNKNTKIVIEIDGIEHYSYKNPDNINVASTRLYAEQMKSDRKLKLKGYTIFRFGGYEFKGAFKDEFKDEVKESLKAEMQKIFRNYFKL